MAKQKATVYLDEDVLRAVRVHAARAGKRDSDVVESALRRYLGIEALERIWEQDSGLTEDEAMSLALEAVREVRGT
jgi:hypothetical protein